MTSEDGESLSEDELDAIAERVADRLQGDRQESAAEAGDSGEPDVDDAVEQARDAAETARERAREEASTAREQARTEADAARERARRQKDAGEQSGGRGIDDLGDRIERSVEASLEAVAQDLERAFGARSRQSPESSGVTVAPGDTDRKAVYKTQLQKGGRVAVPDTEIEALDLAPGDTLQVVLYPVD